MTAPELAAPSMTASPRTAPSRIPSHPAGPDGPPLVEAPAQSPGGWLAAHRDALHETVREHGAVLIRGLGADNPETVQAVAGSLLGELMIEREGFAPRTAHPGRVYSGFQWSPEDPVCPHHELSYADPAPGLLLLACARRPDEGGAVMLADGRRVLADLPPDLVAEFAEHGWRLRRSYRGELGSGLAQAFGGDTRAEVERYCRDGQIGLDWLADGTPRTTQRRPALVIHPVTGEAAWCNQIAFLSGWTLDTDVRDYLLAVHGPDGLPFDTARGDGQPLSAEVIGVLNAATERVAVPVPWQPGDLLLIDNVRMAHGRQPYQGQREVLVALGRPVHLTGRIARWPDRP
jgi:alpha-ketoglutarate-dependent taurine dioxygenase